MRLPVPLSLYALLFIISEINDQDIYHSNKASSLQIIRMATPSVFVTVFFAIMKSLSKNCCKIVGHYQVPLTKEAYLLMNEQKDQSLIPINCV